MICKVDLYKAEYTCINQNMLGVRHRRIEVWTLMTLSWETQVRLLAAYASMAAVGRSLRLNWGQRMCVSCTAYACAVFWVAKLCAMGA